MLQSPRWARGAGTQRRVRIRVLVALEEEHRVYREVIAAGIVALRPHVEAEARPAENVSREMARFEPRLVISSRQEETSATSVHAWAKVPMDPTQPMEVRVGERRWTSPKPTLEALLEIIDSIAEA